MDKYQIAKEGWSIVATDDLTVQRCPASKRAAHDLFGKPSRRLQKLKQEDPAKAARLRSFVYRN